MAVQEQIERLKRSVEEWNQWRQEQPEIRPDLSFADLIRANLSTANLSETNFSRANLGAAYLSDSNLSGADLGGANLSGADLFMTNLSTANFCGAILKGADLTNAILSGAILSGTYFSYTTFAWVDLNNVKGLETAIHHGPSIVDINSVMLPTDKHTRTHFLRGAGFTETQIDYLPSLLTPRPIQYQSLFISYASQDEVIARRLYAALREHDVPCWFAPHDLQPGNYFRERIDQAIHTQDKLLLLLSENSVQSGWVRYEVELALARENRQQREILFPIRLDDAIFHCTASWATSLQATRHIGDFTGWRDGVTYNQAFTTLLRHLKVAKSPTT